MSTPSGTRVLVLLGNARLNGQERGNIEAARAVRSAGAEVLLVTHSQWGHQYIQPFLDGLGLAWTPLAYAYHFRKGMRAVDVLRNGLRLLAASWAFWRIVRAFRPTHIHAANPHYVLSVLPALLLLRTPLVYRLGDEPTEHNRFYRTLWRRFIVPRVQTFVCNSAFIRSRLLATGAPPERVRVILSAPAVRPTQDTTDLPPDLRAEHEGAAPRFAGRTVVFLGQMAPHKGVHLLVEAALALCAERDDVRFLIAGVSTTRDGFVTGLAAQVLQARQTDRIRFLGYVADVDGLLALADIHCAPSVWEEPLANVVLEAKRAGVPSVLFPSGGLPELVTTPGLDAVVCADRTAEALRDGLRSYLGAPDLAPARAAARASLEALGATTKQFTRAWSDVYGVETLAPEPAATAHPAEIAA
jgi:glycosyltransferase involved in cell wall biosynthesis